MIKIAHIYKSKLKNQLRWLWMDTRFVNKNIRVSFSAQITFFNNDSKALKYHNLLNAIPFIMQSHANNQPQFPKD